MRWRRTDATSTCPGTRLGRTRHGAAPLGTRCSGGSALVAMVQASDLRQLDQPLHVRALPRRPRGDEELFEGLHAVLGAALLNMAVPDREAT